MKHDTIRARLSRAGARAALTMMLAAPFGCETLQAPAHPELPLWVLHPGAALDVVFRQQVTAVGRVSGEPYEHGQPEIDVPHKRIFVGSSDGGLYARRADNGDGIWRFETLGPVQTVPLYDPVEDVVYFGSNDGALYKVAAADGALKWRFATNAEIGRKPVLQNGIVYVVNANDTVVAIDAPTGKLRWTQHRTPAFGMEIAGYAGPLVTPERVYVAFSDGHVAAFDPEDGTERWPLVDLSAEVEQIQGDLPRYFDVDTTPVFDTIAVGRVVYVASYAGGVFALDAQTGARVWLNDRAKGVTDLMLWQEPAHPARDGGPAVPARKMLLASSGTTGLWAIGTDDGRDVWRRPVPEGGASAPVPIAGALLVSTTRYGLFLMSPLDGAVIDGLDLSNGLAMAPAVHGRRAFVMSNSGVLLGISVEPAMPHKGMAQSTTSFQ
ncbi:MAG TPA: PQQ-binding-like beta-propeller repeat protein [Polyangiaceae bacterium]